MTLRQNVIRMLTAALLAGPTAIVAEPDPRIDDLRAFVELYGYVRFFHPSDEAAAIDWDAFAVHGASEVLASDQPLIDTLRSLTAAIAPALCLSPASAPPCDPALPEIETPESVDLVAWQHRGVGLTPGMYRSVRTHRPLEVPVPFSQGSGTVTQTVDAEPYRGQQVRLRARVRAEVKGTGNQAHLWLRIDRAEGMGLPPGKMAGAGRPITGAGWSRHEIVGEIGPDAEGIAFGGLLKGLGRVWLDAFALAVRSSADAPWQPLPVANAGFEAHGSLVSSWSTASPGYGYSIDDDNPGAGERSLLITGLTGRLTSAGFDAVPALLELIERDLGAAIRLRMPVALASRDGHTLPRAEAAALERLTADLDAATPSTSYAASAPLRIAAVAVAWNVFQHFYPYFDVVEADWDSILTEALSGAVEAANDDDFRIVLERLTAALGDGHAHVLDPGQTARGTLPLAFGWIEEQVVVTASAVSGVERGDLIRSIDGDDARTLVRDAMALVSGSLQWKRVRALRSLGKGEAGTAASLVLAHGSEERTVTVERLADKPPTEARPESFDEVAEGVVYVDLSRAPWPEIEPRLDALAAARGVIFDLRGYPQGNHAVLQHLTDTPIRSAHWQVPQTIFPDRERLVGYDISGRWDMPPLAPRFRGTAVFLTDARAISYAESVMGIVEHYRLGEIVGRATAGANGNVNPFVLPGGYRVTWTGMRVIKHDETQHHLIGIRPTIPVARTIDGVRQGRDEDLERALAVIESKAAEIGPAAH